MGNHLVLVGGGHAHMTTLLRIGDFIKRGHRVTLISTSPFHYYSGMGPGMLGRIYDPMQVCFNIRKMAEDRGAIFIRGSAARIDAAQRLVYLDSGDSVHYDIASFNTGSDVMSLPIPEDIDRIFPVKPVRNLYRARISLLREIERRPLEIVVLGGGPAGLEITGNIRRLLSEKPYRANITLIGGSRIMGSAPEKVRRIALQSLEARGISIREGVKGKEIRDGSITLSDGNTLFYDFVFIATGIVPSPLFLDSSLPTGADGGLLVNSCLQSVAHPELFGGGDCIALDGTPLAKVGVYAVRQNPVLLLNLMAAMEGGCLKAFDPGGPYMLILNMGDGTGILWKKSIVINGRSAFLVKDFIDRRFIKKFQVSGEPRESNEEDATGT
jgi:NADH dehydrogenase FAD-containing subunit